MTITEKMLIGSKTSLCTVKRARGKVSFDSQTDKYASQLSSEASPEVRCDKYASGEA
jgi:hypothetical protein